MRTAENRDYAAIGVRGDEVLSIVLDGSTAGRDSGLLAQQIATDLIDGYVSSDDRMDAEDLLARLRDLHAALVPIYPQASASYLIALIREGEGVVTLHAGDCLIGRPGEKGLVEWLCRPHTLANALDDLTIAAIAAEPARHRLTRSFRAREFMRPETARLQLDQQLIVATDGFWADLSPEEQLSFLGRGNSKQAVAGDDCSALEILITGAPHGTVATPQPQDTLHVRRREEFAAAR